MSKNGIQDTSISTLLLYFHIKTFQHLLDLRIIRKYSNILTAILQHHKCLDIATVTQHNYGSYTLIPILVLVLVLFGWYHINSCLFVFKDVTSF